jgi:hypothetical protein
MSWRLAGFELIWRCDKRSLQQANDLEQLLRANPSGQGESRSGRERFTVVGPLAATFRIEDDGRTVTVLHLRVYRPRAQQ